VLRLLSAQQSTGAGYGGALLKQLTETVAAHPQVLTLSDEIYEHIVYDGERHVPTLAVAPQLRARILTVNGVSKAYAMTGWRIGYAGGPEWLASTMAKVQSQTSGKSSTIGQAAAEAALQGDQSSIAEWRGILERRRDAIIAALSKSGWLSVSTPAGAFYVFVDVGRCIGLTAPHGTVMGSDLDLSSYLLDKADVATVAGEAFGASPFLRLSFAADDTDVLEAARRIVGALDRLVPSGATGR
jgi:aspartate aminotransferase